jgi:amino acid transporter
MKVRMKSLLAGAAVLVLLAVKLIAHFYPGCRLWGLNQLAYFSLPLAIISMALIIILIFLIAYGSRHKVKSRVVEKVKTFMNVFPRILFLSVCVVVILVLFYIFSDSTNLLGDGTLRIQELDNLQQVPTTEPLDFLVHDLTYDYILKPLG